MPKKSNVRGLRTVSDRLGLGSNGPSVIIEIAITLIVAMPALIWFVTRWAAVESNGLLRFAPLVIVVSIGSRIVRKVQAARADAHFESAAPSMDAGSTDFEPIHSLRSTPITHEPRPMNEFWDAAIGDQLRMASNRLDLGPHGARLVANLLVWLLISLFVLAALVLLGPGVPWWFSVLALATPITLFARSALSIRSDASRGWRDGTDQPI